MENAAIIIVSICAFFAYFSVMGAILTYKHARAGRRQEVGTEEIFGECIVMPLRVIFRLIRGTWRFYKSRKATA